MPGEPEGEITLRSNIEEVSEALKDCLLYTSAAVEKVVQ